MPSVSCWVPTVGTKLEYKNNKILFVSVMAESHQMIAVEPNHEF
jgi:hypothetical protein